MYPQHGQTPLIAINVTFFVVVILHILYFNILLFCISTTVVRIRVSYLVKLIQINIKTIKTTNALQSFVKNLICILSFVMFHRDLLPLFSICTVYNHLLFSCIFKVLCRSFQLSLAFYQTISIYI